MLLHLLSFAVVLLALVSPSIQGIISPVPNCFVCPPSDLAGRPLGPHSNSASELFCRYESVPNDFFCKYFTVTLFDRGLLFLYRFFLTCLRVRARDCLSRITTMGFALWSPV